MQITWRSRGEERDLNDVWVRCRLRSKSAKDGKGSYLKTIERQKLFSKRAWRN